MSGHSKWSTIKRKKEATDVARGKIFSKLSNAIIVAAKTGGSSNPSTNFKLKIAVDAAKSANMPKSNIERVLSKAESTGDLYEMTYEGFGPDNVAILVDIATDNKNRSAQEVKQIFDKNGGIFGGSGSVAYNFESKGMIVIKKGGDPDEQMLKLIGMGVEDVEVVDDAIEIYTDARSLSEIKKGIDDAEFEVLSADLVQKPTNMVQISDEKVVNRAVKLLEKLEDHEDVQKVYSNLEVVC